VCNALAKGILRSLRLVLMDIRSQGHQAAVAGTGVTGCLTDL
jgi:hypothetical protein